jgi:uncharacterized membrane protein YfhO
LGSKYIVKKEKQDIIDTLFHKDFDRRNTIILEITPNLEPKDGEGSLEVIYSSPNRFVLNVNTAVPKILFRSEVFDNGWNVKIDKKPSIIYRADYDFQAVMVSEGTHVVEFYYWPKKFTIGLVVSGISLSILIGIIIFFVRRK